MDSSTKPSGIPRLSRLPLPRTNLKPTPSGDDLRSSRMGAPTTSRIASQTPREQQVATTPQRQPTIPQRAQTSSLQSRLKPAASGTLRSLPFASLGKSTSQGLRPRRSVISDQTFNPQDDRALQKTGNDDKQERSFQQVSRNQDETTDAFSTPRKPSLTERAMESLQNTPSARRRRSSFFNADSPMRPPSRSTFSSRPDSSHDGQMRPPSRPGSRASTTLDFRASTNSYRAASSSSTSSSLFKETSRSSLRGPSVGLSDAQRPTKLASSNQNMQSARSPSPMRTTTAPDLKPGSRTMASRPPKPRASVNNLFEKSSISNPSEGSSSALTIPKRKQMNSGSSTPPSQNLNRPIQKQDLSHVANEKDSTPRKSSSALRDQIAKAKAAKRAAVQNNVSSQADEPIIPADNFDFGLSDDPFGQRLTGGDSAGLLKRKLKSARLDGRLNISAMGLKSIPDEVMKMYDLDANDGSWAECVDLIRFVAAGNEIETIADHVFPDVDPKTYLEDENAIGNQFGALEVIDLHSNHLITLPIGLRRLERLVSLDIADNKLDNTCFDVISQISTLQDLKLSGNVLSGALDIRVADLSNLERLDLHNNALTSISGTLERLSNLRSLNMSGNRFSSFSFSAIQHLPLTQILLAKNKLSGTLFEDGFRELPSLQTLDITGNSIDQLCSTKTISLPALTQLNMSFNRVATLPEVTSWISLQALIAEDNIITSIPEGFTSLQSLQNVDFRGNNIRVIQEQVGNMANLNILRLGGNPLRDKKFAGMSTEELKHALRARLQPLEPSENIDQEQEDGDDEFRASPLDYPAQLASSDWQVSPTGVLDRSNQKTTELDPARTSRVVANHEVITMKLNNNQLSQIPMTLGNLSATLTTLDLSKNVLSGHAYLQAPLSLPALSDLNMGSNLLCTLQPLLDHLEAPSLSKLDASFNQLTSLPTLRASFPVLSTLLVSNNAIKEVLPEAIRGLRVLDCSNNEIEYLNPRVGLLGGVDGLHRLDVSGNRFRVPKYTILDKGTEAVMLWLKDRIPAEELDAPEDEETF